MVAQDRTHPPAGGALRALLGPSHGAWETLLASYPELRPEWKWYGAKSGWSLKLLDGKRNLCFMVPRDGQFTVAFVFGHAHVEQALHGDLEPALKHELAEAPTYPEGRPLRITVTGDADLEPVHTLLRIKRGAGQGKRASGPPRHPVKRASRRPPSSAPKRPRPEKTTPSHRRGRTPGA